MKGGENMKAKLILIGSVTVVALSVLAFNSRRSVVTTAINAEEITKQAQIAAAQADLDSIKDKGTQEYENAKKEYCDLAARSEADRQQAIANVKEFVHAIYPASSKDYPVTFDCGRDAYEYYQSANWQFIVDPINNAIIEMGEAPRSWDRNGDSITWQSEAPEYDYTPRYNEEAAGQVAEKFLIDNKNILGIDAAQMTREYEGTKDGGDGITPGDKVNYFFVWRNKDSAGKTTELVNVTITRGGQVVVFDNDTYNLKKNSN